MPRPVPVCALRCDVQYIFQIELRIFSLKLAFFVLLKAMIMLLPDLATPAGIVQYFFVISDIDVQIHKTTSDSVMTMDEQIKRLFRCRKLKGFK